MTEQKSNNSQQLYYAGIAAVIIVLLVALWWLFAPQQPEPVVQAPAPVEVPAVIEAEPQPQPATDAGEAEAEAPVTAQTEPEPEPAVEVPVLPALEQSDVEVKQRLLALDWRPGLANLFVTEDMLRSLVVQIDNIAQGQLVAGQPVLMPLEQRFSLDESEPLLLEQQSFGRYEPYIQLLESVPPQQLIPLFQRYEPLLQQAYAELGYPDELFKNKLIAAIDLLLATPEVEYPLELERPSVVYIFADPAIEQLPAPQKQMIRLGPDNQNKIKALLQRYRAELTSAP
ncbi:DUF3014 domain-containing protein [Rheinheimera sp.]|uniref:DUF3014 domain-containing protein n=1 Tax=Rheinheimera sp. TaxID=1869214 RepID=UPI002736AA60|nr:DUF3014 domain-containing protein [Rheinheimera sp.]MDP2715262.1 DUF3014 domain-containing protein [Rheinheimera sp.]